MKLTKYYNEDDEVEVSEKKLEHWESLWKPYEELSEEQKDKDRKWARKAIQVIKDCGRSTKETVCPECGEVSHFAVRPDCTEEDAVRGCRDEKARCSNCNFREKGENLTEEYTKTLVEVKN